MDLFGLVLVHFLLLAAPPLQVPSTVCGCPKEMIGGEHRIVRGQGSQILSSYDVDPLTGSYYFGILSETPPPKGQSDLTAAAQGRLFSSELKPLGSAHTFAAAKETLDIMAPRMFGVNFNSRDRQWLATWILASLSPGNNSGQVLGQLLTPDGIAASDPRTILTLPRQPAIQPLRVVYNKSANEYVLLYSRANLRQDKDQLFLLRIDHNLAKTGSAVLVDPEFTSTEWEEIRLDPEMHHYLVTWQTYQYGRSSRIRAALFSSDLKRLKAPQTVALTEGVPRTTYSAAHQAFAIFWQDATRSTVARLMKSDGRLSGILDTGMHEFVSTARANPVTGGFVLMVRTSPMILRLDHDFRPTQSPERISCGTVPERTILTGLLFNPKAAEFLATWSYDYGAQFGGYDVYAARVREVSAGSCSN